MKLFPFSLTFLIAGALGWLVAGLKPDHFQDSGDQVSSKSSSLSRRGNLATPLSSLGEIGAYQLQSDGRRVYQGARDLSILERMSRVDGRDSSGMAELMSQMSQMNDSELADAWAELSRQAPRSGNGPVMVAAYVTRRLTEAGIDFEVPLAWEGKVQELMVAHEAAEVRRNPVQFQEKLVNGEQLSKVQRETLLRSLAQDDPMEAARLWLKHSSGEQLILEAPELYSLMQDAGSRSFLLGQIPQQIADVNERSAFYSNILDEWAFQNRDDAKALARATTDPALKEIAQLAVLKGYWESSPEEALAFASELEGPLRMRAFGQSIEILGEENLDAAVALTAALTNPSDREAASRGLSYSFSKNDYEGFVAWKEDLSPSLQNAVMESAFPMIAQSDVSTAITWLNEQEESPFKEQRRVELMEVYANFYPDSMITLLETFDNPSAKRFGAALTLRHSDPSDLGKVSQVLTVANDKGSGVDLTLPPGVVPGVLTASKTLHSDCGCEH